MPVYRLVLAYDGEGFHGFARQEGLRTVQGVLEGALSRVLRETVSIVPAGRTDAGVHAAGQVVSFACSSELPPDLAHRITSLCGPDVAVVSSERAPSGFDARSSALWRRYRYRILCRDVPDPLRRHIVWHVRRDLHEDAMQTNLSAALGEHDFSAFCRVPEGGHARRRVLGASVERHGDEIHVVLTATAFCHQMVRSLVGTVVAGRSVAGALKARRRDAASPLAPPHGLCLEEVAY